MDPKTILSELDVVMSKLTDAVVVDYRRELVGNTYPLLKMIGECLRDLKKDYEERIELMEDALAEVIAGSDSRIQPRLAKRIHAAFQIGADIVARIAFMHSDQVEYKDFQAPNELLVMMSAYQQAMITAAGMVNDVTIEIVNEEDIEDDDDEDEEEETNDDD